MTFHCNSHNPDSQLKDSDEFSLEITGQDELAALKPSGLGPNRYFIVSQFGKDGRILEEFASSMGSANPPIIKKNSASTLSIGGSTTRGIYHWFIDKKDRLLTCEKSDEK